jgi:multidrug efflux pump
MWNELIPTGGNGQMIQLSNLVDLRESIAPRELGRTANVGPGYSQGEALAALEEAARRVRVQ